jgi:hypothetical protein
VSFLENHLVKLQLFNELTIKKVQNKLSFLSHIENRQFQTDLANQMLSESEIFSFLCDRKAASSVHKIELEKPIKHTNVTKNFEENLVLQKASSFMPYSTNKKVAIDELKVNSINKALKRVGVVSKPLEVTDLCQGASLMKVQMEVPPEITYTSITRKLVDIQGARGKGQGAIKILRLKLEISPTLSIYIFLWMNGNLFISAMYWNLKNSSNLKKKTFCPLL